MKYYTNTHTEARTTDAAAALTWHRDGVPVMVTTLNEYNHPVKSVLVAGASQNKPTFDDECLATCERIAKEVEAYAAGNIYRCPDCREELHLPDDVGDKYLCPCCGTIHETDDLEQLSIYDYMEDILDVDFTISRTKEYRSCSVCVGLGGPNIYIETDSSYVKLYWGNSRAEYPLSYSARDKIDEWAEEYFNCL